jgi:hypothetical protein
MIIKHSRLVRVLVGEIVCAGVGAGLVSGLYGWISSVYMVINWIFDTSETKTAV